MNSYYARVTRRFICLLLDVRSQRYRKSALKVSDTRVSLVSEVIDGIKTVKLGSLGKLFQTRVGLLREKELASVRHALTLNAYNQVRIYTLRTIAKALGEIV